MVWTKWSSRSQMHKARIGSEGEFRVAEVVSELAKLESDLSF